MQDMQTQWCWQIIGPAVPVTLTCKVAEAARGMVMRTAEAISGSALLPASLHRREGEPGEHLHAFWLPEDRDGDGLVDHIGVFVPGGLCRTALLFLSQSHVLSVTGFTAMPLRGGLTELPNAQLARHWQSTTPFIGPLHAWRGDVRRKKRGMDAASQLRRELARTPGIGDEMAAAVKIEQLPEDDRVPAESYSLGRRTRNKPAAPVRGFFRLSFPDMILGPLVFGLNAHFGMVSSARWMRAFGSRGLSIHCDGAEGVRLPEGGLICKHLTSLRNLS